MKCIKDFLKNWILAHERAYWYIIFGIAIGLFALITAIGVGKVYSAEAAEVEPMAVIDGVSIPDIRNADWSEYAEYFETEYGYMGNIGEKIVREHKYCVITVNPYLWPDNVYYFTFLFTNEPVQYNDNSSYWLLADWNTSVAFQIRDGVVCTLRGYGHNNWDGTSFGYDADMIPFVVGSSNNSCITIASTYDFRNGQLSYHDSYQQISYPEKVLDNNYDADAPYISFLNLDVDNRLNKRETFIGTNAELYSVFFSTSSWTYTGKLNNVSFDDQEYKLNIEFNVEVPTSDYVNGLYDYFGYDSDKDKVVLKRNADLVDYWNKDNDAEFRTIEVQYTIDVFPDTDGNVSYTFTFPQWEYLLRVYCPELVEEFATYDARWRSVVLSFMHVKKITTEVVTTRTDDVVYGGFTTNVFERGVYNSCVEVFTAVDKNFVDSDKLDDIISDDLRDAEQQYIKDLENRVDELENQMNGVGDAFGDLNGSDLWSGFRSLSNGLASMGPAVRSIAGLCGSVLSFIPTQVTGMISFTLLALCIIAIIKAIRG